MIRQRPNLEIGDGYSYDSCSTAREVKAFGFCIVARLKLEGAGVEPAAKLDSTQGSFKIETYFED